MALANAVADLFKHAERSAGRLSMNDAATLRTLLNDEVAAAREAMKRRSAHGLQASDGN